MGKKHQAKVTNVSTKCDNVSSVPHVQVLLTLTFEKKESQVSSHIWTRFGHYSFITFSFFFFVLTTYIILYIISRFLCVIPQKSSRVSLFLQFISQHCIYYIWSLAFETRRKMANWEQIIVPYLLNEDLISQIYRQLTETYRTKSHPPMPQW